MATIVNLVRKINREITQKKIPSVHISEASTQKKAKAKEKKKPATSEKENFIVRSLRPPQASKQANVSVYVFSHTSVRVYVKSSWC